MLQRTDRNLFGAATNAVRNLLMTPSARFGDVPTDPDEAYAFMSTRPQWRQPSNGWGVAVDPSTPRAEGCVRYVRRARL